MADSRHTRPWSMPSNPTAGLFLPSGALNQASGNARFLKKKSQHFLVCILSDFPEFIKRIQHTATSDNQGRIWIWGGQSSGTTTTPVPGQVVRSAFDNRWAVIDTSTWTYSYPDIPNAPPARIDHTATLAGDGNIYIIGGLMYSRNVTDPTGQQTLNPVSMSSLLKFDAASSQWQNVTATGNIPAPRGGHSATLSSDGTAIIVFGGGTVDDGESNLLNDVFVLELATMRWSAPSITGLPPSPRKYHYARLVGPESLLVCFGLTDVLATSDVNLLDLRTGSWVTTYTPDAAWLAGNATALALNNTLHLTNDSLTTNSTLHPTNDTRPTQTATASSITLSSAITKGTGENEPSHVGAGILAGVISGGVVVVSRIVYYNEGRERRGYLSTVYVMNAMLCYVDWRRSAAICLDGGVSTAPRIASARSVGVGRAA
ncbi:hypothetical protein BCR43DRAFT_492742 [Syncephalastrum racemosum]|uniref:Galactose oxidase n=1 Tax=Syncephalastrum racemosum TaxID=13706 RepID=A0A1X2H9D9_SYNRA|nr:hypothetical protein BCR43DRAFT_492742 [Syncephalastrum racemosum]